MPQTNRHCAGSSAMARNFRAVGDFPRWICFVAKFTWKGKNTLVFVCNSEKRVSLSDYGDNVRTSSIWNWLAGTFVTQELPLLFCCCMIVQKTLKQCNGAFSHQVCCTWALLLTIQFEHFKMSTNAYLPFSKATCSCRTQIAWHLSFPRNDEMPDVMNGNS